MRKEGKMKVQIIYSSLSGCTRRLAEGIFDALTVEDKELYDLAAGAPALDGDAVLLGYWVDKGGPDAAMKAFMETIEGKNVGVFCTLAYWADSAHAHAALAAGAALVKEKNCVLGGYVCNGAMSQAMIDRFRANGASGPHSASPANEARWALMKNHPTAAEITLAAERFNERLCLLQTLETQGLEYPAINL